MNDTPTAEPDEPDEGAETTAMLLEGIEDNTGRIADALEKAGDRKSEAANPPPAIHVAAPQVTIRTPAGPKGFEFTFHRDAAGRLTGCTAEAKP